MRERLLMELWKNMKEELMRKVIQDQNKID
jgi:hypothetical protein